MVRPGVSLLQILLVCAVDRAANAQSGLVYNFPYNGCYKNQYPNRDGGHVRDDEGRAIAFSIVGCNDWSFALGKPYFGLENPQSYDLGRTTCLPLDGVPPMESADDSDCQAEVEGGVFMGAANRVAIYGTEDPTTTTTTLTITTATTSATTATNTSSTTSWTSSTTASVTTSTTTRTTTSTTASTTTSTTPSTTTSMTTSTRTTTTTSTTTRSSTMTTTTSSATSSTTSTTSTTTTRTMTSTTTTASVTTTSTTTASTTWSTSTTASATETTTSSSRTDTTVTSTPTTTTSSTNTSTVTSTTLSATNTTATQTNTIIELTASVLVDRMRALEGSLFTALVEDNLATATVRVDGITLVATKLDAVAALAAGDTLTVPLDDSEAAVTVPASLFSSLSLGAESVVLMAANINLTNEGFTSSGNESEVQVAAVMNLDLLTLAGRRLDVAGLMDPIKLVMPVNHSASLQCVYWDEESLGWATEGVELGSRGAGIVECEVKHLTLFAAVLRGFVNTFACSQVALLNAESIGELGGGDWCWTIGALTLWCLLAAFILLLSLAAWLDWRRWRQGRRSDEHFLVPLHVQQREDGDKGKAEVARRLCAAGCAAGGIPLMRHQISALIERLEPWCGRGGAAADGRVGTLVQHLASTVLVVSARRQVAASLGVSAAVSSLIMEDEDVFDAVMAHHARELDSADLELPSRGLQRGASSTALAREEAWGQLHHDVEAKLDKFMGASAAWSSLPCTVWLLFLHQNPFNMCLVHCAFTSCKQRVLLFVLRITGSLMLTTVFFTSAGVPKKQGRSLDCRIDDPFEIAGRILATGTASMLIAGIPTLILRSLCTRGLKKFDYEGCPKWNRQLKTWRMQDRAIWILGLLYLVFCIFFVCLFLANVDQMDHGSWLLSGLLSVAQKTLLLPVAVALVLPLLATTCLQFMSFRRRVTKKELVCELCLQFKSRVNMNVSVGMI